MNLADRIVKVLEKTGDGVVLIPSDFGVPAKQQPSLIVALNRMVDSGKLSRLSRGKYYKPRNSIFGLVPPSTYEKVKDYLVKDGNAIGYITGTNAFANLGLTTQISGTICIGTNTYHRPKNRGVARIAFISQPNPICEEDTELYVLLDALRFIQRIPACTPDEALQTLIPTIRRLPKPKQKRLQELALAYQPSVRALLGAIYEKLSLSRKALKASLNGTTYYRLHIDDEILPTKSNWRII